MTAYFQISSLGKIIFLIADNIRYRKKLN